LLDRYGFMELPRGGFKHQDGREIHFNASNWSVINGSPEQRVIGCGQGLQELGAFLALTHQEKLRVPLPEAAMGGAPAPPKR
jgi:hypothetical protein